MKNHHDAFLTAENNFFSMISTTQIDYGNLVAFVTGVQAAGLNPAIVNQVDPSFSKQLTTCKSFYLEQNLPWALLLPEYFHNDDIEKILQHHSLGLTDKGVAMAVQINDLQFPSIETTLNVQKINGDLNIWSIPLIHGFESTPEITDVYTIRHAHASHKNTHLHHFSGFIGDTVICSLSLSVCENYARIDDVATMPTYQKKGYATQLMYAALKYAQHLNVETCFLEASTEGLSLYTRMGFKQLFINRYYEIQGDK